MGMQPQAPQAPGEHVQRPREHGTPKGELTGRPTAVALCLSLSFPRESGRSGCTDQGTGKATAGARFLLGELQVHRTGLEEGPPRRPAARQEAPTSCAAWTRTP